MHDNTRMKPTTWTHYPKVVRWLFYLPHCRHSVAHRFGNPVVDHWITKAFGRLVRRRALDRVNLFYLGAHTGAKSRGNYVLPQYKDVV